MARRTNRSRLIHRLITPLRSRLARRVPRVRRSFSPVQPRWSLAPRLFVPERAVVRARRDRL